MFPRRTRESVVEDFQRIHSNWYDYSLFRYKNAVTKSSVICPEHGMFEISANKHLGGQGCRECGIARRSQKLKSSRSEIIKQFKALHGEKYNYEKFKYVNSVTKSTVICPTHGPFEISANKHLQDQGCRQCGIKARSNLQVQSREELIEKFTELYGTDYDYSQFKFVDEVSSSTVICPTHGPFEISPIHHLNKKKCPGCHERRVTSKEKAIEQFREIHGDFYDYSKFEYTSSITKSAVICPTHGSFQISANKHLQGRGCRQCGIEKMVIKQATPREKVIEKFIEKHGTKYDYSLFNAKNLNDKSTIICPKHGPWETRASIHLQGSGCSACSHEFGALKFPIRKPLAREQVLVDFEKIHGSRYDYSQFEYRNDATPSIIICRVHGPWKTNANTHKNGSGCRKCSNEARIKPWDQVLQSFIDAHGSKYDYTEYEYKDTMTKSTVICPDHGPWDIEPHHHSRGVGCRKCHSSKGEVAIAKHLTSLNISFIQEYAFIRPYRFDFYLDDLGFVIEFDGAQHFQEDKNHFHKRERSSYHNDVVRDVKKIHYCVNHDIPILRIHYKDLKDIPQFIDEFLENPIPIALSRDGYYHLFPVIESLNLAQIEL